MPGDDRLERLFAAARAARPDTARAQYGFETRLLARLRVEREPSALWAAWTWRLIPAFAALALALGVWNYAALPGPDNDPAAAIAADFDRELVAYFTGK